MNDEMRSEVLLFLFGEDVERCVSQLGGQGKVESLCRDYQSHWNVGFTFAFSTTIHTAPNSHKQKNKVY